MGRLADLGAALGADVLAPE